MMLRVIVKLMTTIIMTRRKRLLNWKLNKKKNIMKNANKNDNL